MSESSPDKSCLSPSTSTGAGEQVEMGARHTESTHAPLPLGRGRARSDKRDGRPPHGRSKDEIKDYAENTINELLGWYGYDKSANSDDTDQLDLRWTSTSRGASPRQRASSSPSHCPPRMEARREGAQEGGSNLGLDVSTSPSPPDCSSDVSIGSADSSACGSTDDDQRHCSPDSTRKQMASPPSACEDMESANSATCWWCQKKGVNLFTTSSPAPSDTPSNPHPTPRSYCSDVCFTLSRRASFKQNKFCDWCKQVRNTVSYVDLQDGDQQLQFCCSKCLNQYKMNIFCRETEEHLRQLQQQDQSAGKEAGDDVTITTVASVPSEVNEPSGQILITPDLWSENNSASAVAVKQERPETPENPPQLPVKSESSDERSPNSQAIPVTLSGYSGSGRKPCPSSAHGASRRKSGSGKTPQRVVCTTSNSKSPGLSSVEGDVRGKRDRSADSSSSTPLSLLSTTPPSHQSTPKTAYSTSASFSTPYASVSQSAVPTSVQSVNMQSLSSNPMLLNPLFAAGLGGVLPALSHHQSSLAAFNTHMTPGSMTQIPGLDRLHNAAPGFLPPTPAGFPPHLMPQATVANPLVAQLLNSMGVAGGVPPGYPHHPPPPAPHIGPAPFPPLPQNPLLPPNTMMVPYPVLVPLPIPVPIPFPVPPGALEEFRQKEQRENAPTRDLHENKPLSADSPASPSQDCEDRAIRATSAQMTCKQEVLCDQGSIACACCVDVNPDCGDASDDEGSPPVGGSGDRLAVNCSASSSSAPNPIEPHQGPIDLSSKDRHRHTVYHSDTSHEPERNPRLTNRSLMPHPVNILPSYTLAPNDSGYTSRRSRILDAPSMSHDRKRSPSPGSGEKRYYYNIPGRDVYGKRRCIRARVKTK